MSFNAFGRRWSIWVIVVALLIVVAGFIILAALAWLVKPAGTALANTTPMFTVIPAPTSTPMALPGADLTATPTPSSLVVNGVGVGMYVQISGTEGDGLRLRSGPGTDYPPRFLGHESEVFKVMDGPKDANGYTWWYVVTPMDESRSGWAVAKYLSVVAAPTGTP